MWFHGDIAGGNLLVRDGKLAAVLDFGTSGVGDPACDLVIAWTLFCGESRTAFRRTMTSADPAMWARARGWALWKALISIVELRADRPGPAAEHARVAAEVIADARATASLWEPAAAAERACAQSAGLRRARPGGPGSGRWPGCRRGGCGGSGPRGGGGSR